MRAQEIDSVANSETRQRAIFTPSVKGGQIDF